MTKEKESEAKEISFESIMSKLEEVVVKLEAGELSLEQSLRAYEKGVALVRMAEERLKNMEGKIETLMADGQTKPLVLSSLEGI